MEPSGLRFEYAALLFFTVMLNLCHTQTKIDKENTADFGWQDGEEHGLLTSDVLCVVQKSNCN